MKTTAVPVRTISAISLVWVKAVPVVLRWRRVLLFAKVVSFPA